MKKYIFSMIAMLAVCAGFTACGSDDDDPQYSHSQSPSVEMQGVYTGTFTRIQSNDPNAQPESAEGTMVIISGENGYVANAQFLSTDLNISTVIPVNISFANDGAVFSNHKDESTIVGSVNGAGQAAVSFAIKIRVGRSTKPYAVTFSGVKTSNEIPVGTEE